MRRLTALALALALYLALGACGGSPAATPTPASPPAPTPEPTQTPAPAPTPEPNADQEEEPTMNKLNVTFNGHTYTATLAENPSVDAFVAYLRQQGGAITVNAHDYGSFEKVGELGASIVRSDRQIDTVPGDIILYQGSNVCLYYSTNSWNFTPLGKLDGDLSDLRAHLGGGNVDITYSITP